MFSNSQNMNKNLLLTIVFGNSVSWEKLLIELRGRIKI